MYKNEKKYIYISLRQISCECTTILKKNQLRSINLEELIIIAIARLKKIIFQFFPTCNLFYLYKDGSRIPGKNSISSLKSYLLKKRIEQNYISNRCKELTS